MPLNLVILHLTDGTTRAVDGRRIFEIQTTPEGTEVSLHLLSQGLEILLVTDTLEELVNSGRSARSIRESNQVPLIDDEVAMQAALTEVQAYYDVPLAKYPDDEIARMWRSLWRLNPMICRSPIAGGTLLLQTLRPRMAGSPEYMLLEPTDAMGLLRDR